MEKIIQDTLSSSSSSETLRLKDKDMSQEINIKMIGNGKDHMYIVSVRNSKTGEILMNLKIDENLKKPIYIGDAVDSEELEQMQITTPEDLQRHKYFKSVEFIRQRPTKATTEVQLNDSDLTSIGQRFKESEIKIKNN